MQRLAALVFLFVIHIQPARAESSLTMDEFGDFSCGYCAQGSAEMDQLLSDFNPRLRLNFHPIVLFSKSLKAAQAYHAVVLQNPAAGYRFERELFEHQAELSSQGEAFLIQTATKLGIDTSRLQSDMEGPEAQAKIASDRKLFEDHGFQGTPSFVIGKQSIQGVRSYEFFKEVINHELGEESGPLAALGRAVSRFKF